jgi:phospholipid/cholesterol/gamma-HCH transport system permease protein
MAALGWRREADAWVLQLQGCWDAAAIAGLQGQFAAAPLARGDRLRLDLTALQRLELPGAWLLDDWLQRWARAGVCVPDAAGWPESVRVVRQALARGEVAAEGQATATATPAHAVRALGARAVAMQRQVALSLDFVGRVLVCSLRALGQPRRWRPTAIVRHVWDTGITALPIVSLIAFLISVIVAYLSASQLRSFGVDIFVVDLITVGVLRELGVLLTAIIVAGRSGSAFAAEIGAMQLNEEVDALEAAGVDPLEVLVLPRILGLVIALPLLTVIADLIGLAGGALLCLSLLDMPVVQFVNRAELAIADTTFWVGIWKAPAFALLIAMAGTWHGLQVRGSSRELGRLTTAAVVQAIFLVLLADALFAVLFMELDV